MHHIRSSPIPVTETVILRYVLQGRRPQILSGPSRLFYQLVLRGRLVVFCAEVGVGPETPTVPFPPIPGSRPMGPILDILGFLWGFPPTRSDLDVNDRFCAVDTTILDVVTQHRIKAFPLPVRHQRRPSRPVAQITGTRDIDIFLPDPPIRVNQHKVPQSVQLGVRVLDLVLRRDTCIDAIRSRALRGMVLPPLADWWD